MLLTNLLPATLLLAGFASAAPTEGAAHNSLSKRQAFSALWQNEEKRGKSVWAAASFKATTDVQYTPLTTNYQVSNTPTTITAAGNPHLYPGLNGLGLAPDANWRDISAKPKNFNGAAMYRSYVNARKGVIAELHSNSTQDPLEGTAKALPDYVISLFDLYKLEAQRQGVSPGNLQYIMQEDYRPLASSHVKQIIHQIRDRNGISETDSIIVKPGAGNHPDAFFALVGTLSGQRALDMAVDFAGTLNGGLSQCQVGPGDVIIWKLGNNNK